LAAQRRAFRETIRLETATRFAAGQDNTLIARELRVHVRSVQRWRRAYDELGAATLRSKGLA
jgi:transposase